MQTRGDQSAPDETTRLRDLIAECLEHIDTSGEGALEAFLVRHPEDAAFLRERVAALGAVGLGPTAEPIPQRLGDFRIVRRLGGGGMGVVYLAVQESLQREVALKMIRPEHLHFPGARERFRREVESVARLQHPGIVPIYLVGEGGGVPFFAMELVRGKTLAEVVQSLQGQDTAELTEQSWRRAVGESGSSERIDLGRTWVEAALRICLQVGEALEHAHERGVLHRDIKPSNVMLTRGGRALLLDFGLASIQGAHSLTRTGHNVGSLLYMAPEQLLGQSEDVGPWTDVYALGIVLFELLTLRHPFTGTSSEAIRAHILSGEVVSPHSLNRAIPWDVETICLKAISRQHKARYRSASDMVADLRRFLELRPILAERPRATDRLRTWIQRHPFKTLLGVAGGVLLLAGPAAFAIQERFAKARIGAALAQSEASFTRALRAVDELLNEVGARELRNVPRMDEVRARLLARASAHFESFLALRPADRDLRVRARTTAQSFAEALQRLGRFEEAEKQLRRAMDLAVAQVREAPDDRMAQRGVAASHYALGYLFLNMTRPSDAEGEFAEAVRIYRDLVARDQDPDLAHEMAGALSNLAQTLGRAGRLDQAQTAFAEARDVLARVVAAAPERSESREQLGNAWQAIGALHRLGGRLPLARAAQERALELYASLPAARRTERAVRLAEAVSHRHLGDVLADLGEWDAAETALRHSISVRQALAQDHPQVPEYRRDVAVIRIDLGEKLLARGRVDEAEQEQRAAIALLDPLVKELPAVPEHRSHLGLAWRGLAQVLLRQDRAEQAIEAFAVARSLQEEAIASDPKSPSYRMRLADVSALLGTCLLAREDHAGAVRALEESIAVLAEVAQSVQVPAGTLGLLAQRRLRLADALLATGAHERAAAVAQDLAAGERAHRIAAAGILARMAAAERGEGAERAANAAVALLRDLAAEGKDGLAPDAAEFRALRGRAEFEALFQ